MTDKPGLGYFGDRRNQASGEFLMDQLDDWGHGRISIRDLGGDRAGERRIGRFLNNAAVTVEEMMETVSRPLAERSAGREVLAIQDTTSIHVNDQERRKRGRGLAMHATILVDAQDGAVLGPLHAEFLDRPTGRKHDRRRRAYDDKESRRWQTGCEKALERAPRAERVTVVADREGDVFDLFAYRPAELGMVIRVGQNRNLAGGGKLFEAGDGLAVLGRMTVERPAAPGRKARPMTLELRAGSVALDRPVNRRGKTDAHLPEQLDLTLVDVREVDAPDGETPAHWRLLTGDAVETVDEARRIAGIYRRRWAIEQVFRTMKTQGFDIEAVRMRDDAPRKILATAVFVAAVRVLQLVHARDGTTGRPLEDLFDPADRPLLRALDAKVSGKTKKQQNPHHPDSLAWAAWIMARLGGWTGYYGKPGPIVMLRGLNTFHAAQQGWALATQSNV